MTTLRYECDVIGSGALADPYRASVHGLGVNYSAEIPSDPATGAPTSARCVATVDADAAGHALVAATPGVVALD